MPRTLLGDKKIIRTIFEALSVKTNVTSSFFGLHNDESSGQTHPTTTNLRRLCCTDTIKPYREYQQRSIASI
jgi:hypothetical protein